MQWREDVIDAWSLIDTRENLRTGGYDTAIHPGKRVGFGDAGVKATAKHGRRRKKS